MTESPEENVTPRGDQPETAGPSGETPDEVVEEVAQQPSGDAQVEDAGLDAERPAQPAEDELAVTKMALEEATLDLQRVQAEYVNYKKRVDRDRELVREQATFAALAPIIDVLDTIDRAKEHEPLEGGFKAVAEQLEQVVSRVGLVRFGEPGEPFDPTLHEALSHLGTDADVDVTTIKVVAKGGYKIGERVVRAAQVLVVDPQD